MGLVLDRGFGAAWDSETDRIPTERQIDGHAAGLRRKLGRLIAGPRHLLLLAPAPLHGGHRPAQVATGTIFPEDVELLEKPAQPSTEAKRDLRADALHKDGVPVRRASRRRWMAAIRDRLHAIVSWRISCAYRAAARPFARPFGDPDGTRRHISMISLCGTVEVSF